MAKIDYPRYKKVLWRFTRVFVVAFLGAIITVKPDAGDLQQWLVLAIGAGIAAGLEAIAKTLREAVGADYDHIIHKIPL